MTRELTGKESTVATLVAEGLSNKRIAATIKRSERRVRQIIERIASAWELDPTLNYRTQIAQRVVRENVSVLSATS